MGAVKSNEFLQFALFVTSVAAVTPLLGAFLFRVFRGDRTFLSPVLGWLERLVLRLAGIDAPADLLTTSGSGHDPHLSPGAAAFQVRRVAEARKIPDADVLALVKIFTDGPQFGFLGEPRVRILELNLALDMSEENQPAPCRAFMIRVRIIPRTGLTIVFCGKKNRRRDGPGGGCYFLLCFFRISGRCRTRGLWRSGWRRCPPGGSHIGRTAGGTPIR